MHEGWGVGRGLGPVAPAVGERRSAGRARACGGSGASRAWTSRRRGGHATLTGTLPRSRADSPRTPPRATHAQVDRNALRETRSFDDYAIIVVAQVLQRQLSI